MKKQKLKMLKIGEYAGIHQDDPIKFYNLPLIGNMYRKRVERCLGELSGGEKILEVGFGSGVTFLNLNDLYKEIHGLDLMTDVESVTVAFKKLGIQTFLKNGNVLALPYQDNSFDSVLLISILEHLKPESLLSVFREIYRVLKHGGQVVYGVPVHRKITDGVFRLLGYEIEKYHFSDEQQIAAIIKTIFEEVSISNICVWPFGKVYEIGHFIKHRGG